MLPRHNRSRFAAFLRHKQPPVGLLAILWVVHRCALQPATLPPFGCPACPRDRHSPCQPATLQLPWQFIAQPFRLHATILLHRDGEQIFLHLIGVSFRCCHSGGGYSGLRTATVWAPLCTAAGLLRTLWIAFNIPAPRSAACPIPSCCLDLCATLTLHASPQRVRPARTCPTQPLAVSARYAAIVISWLTPTDLACRTPLVSELVLRFTGVNLLQFGLPAYLCTGGLRTATAYAAYLLFPAAYPATGTITRPATTGLDQALPGVTWLPPEYIRNSLHRGSTGGALPTLYAHPGRRRHAITGPTEHPLPGTIQPATFRDGLLPPAILVAHATTRHGCVIHRTCVHYLQYVG